MKKHLNLTLPDLVVLSLLSEQEMHGYQLVTELEIREVQDWAAISRAQVYYSLNKLLKLKHITETKDSDPSQGPERTKFVVSALGRDALEKSLSKSDWATQRPPPPFQTWMALSTHLPKSTLRNLFSERRTYLEEQLEKEKRTFKAFEGELGPMVIAGKLMVDFCIQMFELELKWLVQAEKEMLGRKSN
jgi:DNA-binding PadR family transcriptional regulator